MSKGSFEPYLPRLVREWTRDGAAGPVRELEGTLVSIDISGFTRLSERLQAKGRAGAEELVLLISGVFLGLIGICDRHGGDVLKFRGDALLILFSGPGHERRACHGASHMQWLIEQMGRTMSSVGAVTLRMSVGIYTGLCHFFMVEGSHRELVVTGPGATATIGLESDANAGQILISPRTADALESAWLGQAREGGRLLRRLDVEDADADVVAHFAAIAGGTDDLAEFVPESLRAQLILEAGEAEHRQVTAAFVKFGGVDTPLAAGEATLVHEQLSSLARAVGDATGELGLTWLESDIDIDGGKIYLVGGAPSSTGADEERMVRALRAIVGTDVGLTLRAGVNRGPAFCGDIGAETRRTYAVMGDTVNLAARLTARAKPGQILATADVLDRAHTRYDSEAQPLIVKGKERPITAYILGASLGEKEEEAQSSELPLVGRDTELAALTEAVSAARMRQQQLVELVGEPGIGKSRLVDELKQQALGFTQLIARCDQYSSATPYFVLRTLMRPLAGITPELDEVAAGAQLGPWVQAVMPDLAPWLPLLAIPFGAEVPPTPEVDQIDPAFRRERLQDAVEQFLARVLMMPTLIVLEDIHWADDASSDLVRHLTRQAAPRPWLLCVTRRPQGNDLARDVEGHTRLALEPLGDEAARTLALAAAGARALSQETLRQLTERSGGNPLFVRELVTASRGASDADALPDSVETVILTRMDTLSPEDRFLLRNASVLGARFELDVLAEVLAEELDDVDDLARWDRLAEFVAWEGARELRFLHDLFRAVAYEGLSFKRRMEVHARVGAALEQRNANAALLSLHFLRAEEFERAWRYSLEAGRAAQGEHANVDAAELYGRALDAAEHVELASEEVAAAAEALGDVQELAARYEEATNAYTRARKLNPSSRLLLKEGVIRERLGKYADALQWYGRGLKVADEQTQIELELAYAGVKHRQGRFDEAIHWAALAAEHAEASGNRSGLAHAYHLLDIAHTRLGDGDRSFRSLALPIYEELGDLIGQARVLNVLGVAAYFEGHWNDAIQYYRRCKDVSDRAGNVVVAATATNNEAEILSDQGRLQEAQALFTEALRVWRAAGYPVGIALATSNLGRVAARAGRFEDAHRLLDEALAAFEKIGADSFVAEAEVRLAECLVFEGRHKDAAKAVEGLLAGDDSTYRAALERLAGYAVIQGRAPFAKAKPRFDASLEAARAAEAPYEAALTLLAVAQTGGKASGEADEILARLGVVSTPKVPLP